MSREPAQSPKEAPDSKSEPAADALDGVDWDFDPEDDLVSPLISTERYFRDFPWDGTAEG